MKSILFSFLFIFLFSKSLACTCTGVSEYSNGEMTIEWYNQAELVFEATLDSVVIKLNDQVDFFSTQTAYLSTRKIYKGNIPEKLSWSPWGSKTSCEFLLTDFIGKKLIIYGHFSEDGKLLSHYCNGTKLIYTQTEFDTLKGRDIFGSFTERKKELAFLQNIAKIKTGIIRTYYSNGKLSGSGEFENGIPIKKWIYYTYDGQPSSYGYYLKGKKDSVWNEYYYEYLKESNSITLYKLSTYKTGHYKNNLKEGEWKNFDAKGNYLYSSYYKAGKVIQ